VMLCANLGFWQQEASQEMWPLDLAHPELS
jgi:hypothetical protein